MILLGLAGMAGQCAILPASATLAKHLKMACNGGEARHQEEEGLARLLARSTLFADSNPTLRIEPPSSNPGRPRRGWGNRGHSLLTCHSPPRAGRRARWGMDGGKHACPLANLPSCYAPRPLMQPRMATSVWA